MTLVRTLVVCGAAALIAAPAALAQKWEFGGGVGGGFYTSQDVTAPGGSASAKIASNISGSAWLVNNRNDRWGGELRYDYQRGDLELNQGGTQALFSGMSHAIHYDLVWHGGQSGSKIRPFLAIGAGIKIYQGTGTETAFQQLSQFALLTKDQDLTPLISGGAGVNVQLSPRVQLRAEIHDFATPFPKKVITPNTNAKVGGWLQDFVPMIGISFTSAEGR